MLWWQVVFLVAAGFLLSRIYILSGVYDAVLQLPFMSNKVSLLDERQREAKVTNLLSIDHSHSDLPGPALCILLPCIPSHETSG
jgi:hypothetical protein